MGAVVLVPALSLDGFVGRDDDVPGPLFDWFGNGDVEMSFSDRNRPFRVTEATADFMRPFAERAGVMVCGRHLFDITDGWEGVPRTASTSSWSPTGRPTTGRTPARRGSPSCPTCGPGSSGRGSSPATGTSR